MFAKKRILLLEFKIFLYQYSIAMINLVLNNLRCPASEGLNSSLQFHGMISKLNGFIALARTRTAEKRKTSLFGVICTGF